MKIKLTTIFMLAISMKCMAFQAYSVKNGDDVNASIFQDGLSRIYLTDDRISHVKGIAGEFQLDKNDEIGDIYIKPIGKSETDVINLFIQTEAGNAYALNLKTSSKKPESIRIDAKDIKMTKENIFDARDGHKEEIIDLIKQAGLGREIKGYYIYEYDAPSEHKTKKKLVSVIEKTYHGKYYRIDVINVENHTNQVVTLHKESISSGKNVAAIGFERIQLNPEESGRAYRVVRI